VLAPAVSERSADGGRAVTVTLAASSPIASPGVEVGSRVPDAVTSALLTIGPWAVTVATMSRLRVAPDGTEARLQTPAANVPTDGAAETSVNPAGNASVTSTAVAASGPLLLRVSV
jgi:hypothetical protein